MVPWTILNFLLTIKINFFLFFTYVKSSRSPLTWEENLPQTDTFFSFSFLSTSPAIRITKWVHVWRQLDNEASTWFPKLHRIERACEFLPLIYHCSTKWIDFRLQTSLICKRKKTTSYEKWLLGGVLQNSFPKNFSKFTEKYLCDTLVLTLLKVFMPSGLQHI